MSGDLPARYTLRARYVLDGRGRVFEDGFVAVDRGAIAAIGAGNVSHSAAMVASIDMGDVVVLPGLINAHTHLEFSSLREPLGTPGMRLVDWIPLVIAQRVGRSARVGELVAAGLAESVAGGAAYVGEIATDGWSGDSLDRVRIGGTVFFEVIGLLPQQRAECLERARELLQKQLPQTWRAGISPHAPYSVSQPLVADLVELARRRGVPVAMHLAESPEEIELLKTGGGPFRDWLDSMGIWSPEALARGSRILDYLRILAAAPRALAIHGNYLEEEEIDFLARHRRTMSVVYCPRTHAFFGHAPHPIERLLAAEAHVALGTDSRASNPSLSMLEEMRFLARTRRAISREQVVWLATLAGAEALGISDDTGSLEPGKQADLIVVPVAPEVRRDPYAALLDSEQPVCVTIRRGQVVFGELPQG